MPACNKPTSPRLSYSAVEVGLVLALGDRLADLVAVLAPDATPQIVRDWETARDAFVASGEVA